LVYLDNSVEYYSNSINLYEDVFDYINDIKYDLFFYRFDRLSILLAYLGRVNDNDLIKSDNSFNYYVNFYTVLYANYICD